MSDSSIMLEGDLLMTPRLTSQQKIIGVNVTIGYKNISIDKIRESKTLAELKSNAAVDIKIRPEAIILKRAEQITVIKSDGLSIQRKTNNENYSASLEKVIQIANNFINDLDFDIHYINTSIDIELLFDDIDNQQILSPTIKTFLPTEITQNGLMSGLRWISVLDEQKLVEVQLTTSQKKKCLFCGLETVVGKDEYLKKKNIKDVVLRETDYITNELIEGIKQRIVDSFGGVKNGIS